MPFASVYPHYVATAEKNGRPRTEVDTIVRWLTPYTQARLHASLQAPADFENFLREGAVPDSHDC